MQKSSIDLILHVMVDFHCENIYCNDTVELKNLCAVHRTIVVKLPLLRAVWAGQGSILRFVILMEFFLGPWLDVCQFVEISNQMESNGEVTSIERIFLYNATLYKFFCKMFTTSPVGSIWLEMSINWHTTSQGPKKKFYQNYKTNNWPLSRSHCS